MVNLVSYAFMEIVCVYGYSLSIYIPAVVRNFVFLFCLVFICLLFIHFKVVVTNEALY